MNSDETTANSEALNASEINDSFETPITETSEITSENEILSEPSGEPPKQEDILVEEQAIEQPQFEEPQNLISEQSASTDNIAESEISSDLTEEIQTSVPVTIEEKEPAASVETPASEGITEKSTEEVEIRKTARQIHTEKVVAELANIKEKNGSVEVLITGRVRGGLRVVYKDVPMFLPASHFSIKRTPTEQEMQSSVGQKFKVMIHEIQEYDEDRKAVIVSRKKILLEEFWNKINIGDIVEGRVTSIASFGVFVDIGGIEGLIHVSRLSQVHVDNPNKMFKRGDIVRSAIIEIDKERNRIALSRKELEDSPWKDAETNYPLGSRHTGIVRRITDFGAYIELKPGIDGLLRSSELSWTKRFKHPTDALIRGQEILVEVLSVSEEKQAMSLSYKKTQPNPWESIKERFPAGSEFPGIVFQVMPQGVIVSISEDVDGFMPRSKMRQLLKGRKIPFKSGDKIDIIISDINPSEESLILAPKITDEPISAGSHRSERKSFSRRDDNKPKTSGNGSFSLGDLLSDNEKEKLNNFSK
jgi:small subunit ribosomal protein S1